MSSQLDSRSPSTDSKDESINDSARGSFDEGREKTNLVDFTQSPFENLVQNINHVLGPSNGIDSDDVNVEELQQLMARYVSDEKDWSQYAFSDPDLAYTRNLIDRGNGKCNLLVLVWTPDRSSALHDHANAHCVMKILKGQLKETIYDWPSPPGGDELQATAPKIRRETTYATDEVTYMSDQLGLHTVSNPHADGYAVSLHLYTPPNAANHGVHIFDKTTGESSHVPPCHFYSEMGVRI